MLKIRKQRFSFIFLIVLLVVFLSIAVAVVVKNTKTVNIPISSIKETGDLSQGVCESRLAIDGTCIEGIDPGVFAVMIDNHVGARPSAGLSQARLVYETIVEHPITRFLAVFSFLDEVEKIGPIRSARPFYVDWAKEFNGPYVHVGGSDKAIETLNATYKFNLDEFYNGKYFYRDNYRSAPHNVFTSSLKVNQALKDKEWVPEVSFSSWKYNNEVPEDGGIKTLELNFKTSDFLVRWEYDVTTKEYVRYQKNKIHADFDGREIRAKNIAVVYTDSEIVDGYGRLETRTIGRGPSLVFRNGEVVEGYWQREYLADRTTFYDKAGNEITFNIGTTWIEVITPGWAEVKY